MTICAAAICRQGPEYVVVGIADRMYTRDMGTYQVEYETLQPKAHFFCQNVMSLTAGEGDLAHEIGCMTRQEAQATGVSTVGAIASLYAANHTAVRNRRTENFLLGPLGLDREAFLSRQHELDQSLVNTISVEMQNECWHLGTHSLVFGVDPSGPHIYHVVDPGHAYYRTQQGYFAIGIGDVLFHNAFTSTPFVSGMPLGYGLLLMMTAKRQAERAPGVGRTTDIFLARESSCRYLVPDLVNVISEIHQDFFNRSMGIWSEAAVEVERQLPPERLGF